MYLNGQLAGRQLIRLQKSCSSIWMGGLIILSGMICWLAYAVSMFLGKTHHFDLCYCHVHVFTYEYCLIVLRLSVISNLTFYCVDKIFSKFEVQHLPATKAWANCFLKSSHKYFMSHRINLFIFKCLFCSDPKHFTTSPNAPGSCLGFMLHHQNLSLTVHNYPATVNL